MDRAPYCLSYYGDPVKECTCSPTMIARYQKRISGPLLDCIDIHVEVLRIEYEKLANDRLEEYSATIRARVEAAREIQRARFKGTRLACSAERTRPRSENFCAPTPPLKVSSKPPGPAPPLGSGLPPRPQSFFQKDRTIANLAGSDTIGAAHIAEAIQYRSRGKG